MTFSVAYIVFAIFATRICAIQLKDMADRVEVLESRASLSGGWALINPVCADAYKNCGSRFCCPAATECNLNGFGNHCCPIGTSCLAAYQASPRCADDSWSMWREANSRPGQGYFCCLPDQIGTNAYTCVTGDTPVAQTLSASLISPGTGLPPSAVSSVASLSTRVSSSVATAKTTSAISNLTATISLGGTAPAATAQTSTSSAGTAQQTANSAATMRAIGLFLPLGLFAGGFTFWL